MLTSKASSSAPSILTRLSNPVTETFVYAAFVQVVEPKRLCRADIVSASIRNTGPGTLQLSSENFSTVLVSAGESVDVELDPTETLDARCDDDHCLVFVNARRRVGGQFSYNLRDRVQVRETTDPILRFNLPDAYVFATDTEEVDRIDVFDTSTTFTYAPPGGADVIAYDYIQGGTKYIVFGTNGVVRVDAINVSETVLDAGTGTVTDILVNQSDQHPRILYYDDNDDVWIIEPDGTPVANHNITNFSFANGSTEPGRNYALGAANFGDDIIIFDLATGAQTTLTPPSGTATSPAIMVGDTAYYAGPENGIYQEVDLANGTVNERQIPVDFSNTIGNKFALGAIQGNLNIATGLTRDLDLFFFPSTGDLLYGSIEANLLRTIPNLAISTGGLGGDPTVLTDAYDTRRSFVNFAEGFDDLVPRRYNKESGKALATQLGPPDFAVLATLKEVYNPTP